MRWGEKRGRRKGDVVVPERERDVIRSSEIGEKREIGCGCVIPKKKKLVLPSQYAHTGGRGGLTQGVN